MDDAIPSNPPQLNSKWLQSVLSAVAKAPLKGVADALGCDDSTACRVRSGERNVSFVDVLRILDACGYKAVPNTAVCVKRDRYAALLEIATAAMSNPATNHELFWEDE